MALYFGGTQRERSSSHRGEVSQHTMQQAFFLERLGRLNRKSMLLGRYLVPTDRRLQLLNRALLSTYEDCRELGVGAEAHQLLSSR